jgi:hypothetical protein
MSVINRLPLARPLAAFGASSMLAATLIGLSAPTTTLASGGSTLFVTSAVEHPDSTVTLPLHQGLSHGKNVYYVVLEASDGSTADLMGINTSQKLANAANTPAVQQVKLDPSGSIVFPATVNFNPTPGFSVVPGPTGFPPLQATPPAVGESTYSPLIQMPDGVVLNAPQVANDSGHASKVTSIDFVNKTVTYRETHGFQGGKPLRYASFDSSDPATAALEHVTYAPALNQAPTANDDSTASSRASLAAFTNGQTGAGNPNRQGLNSAILDGLDPLNVLRWNPSQGRYSPLWDVHLTQWQVPAAQRTLQKDFGTVQNLADHGVVAGFNGTAQGTVFASSGFIVNCPIISQQS